MRAVPRNRAPSRRFALGIAAASAVLVVVAVAGFVLNAATPGTTDQPRPAQLMLDAAPLWFVLVGGFLVAHRPRNLTAWGLWLLSFGITGGTVAQGVLNYHQAGHAVPYWLPGWAVWIDNSTWTLWFYGLFEIMLNFPDGRLPGRFWRWLRRFAAADIVVCFIVCASLRVDSDYPDVRTPVGLGPLSRMPLEVGQGIVGVTFGLMVLALAACCFGLWLRFRQARGVERAQLKWLLSCAGLAVGVLGVSAVLNLTVGGEDGAPRLIGDVIDVISEAALWLLPLAVAVAVMRYGLFEIDRIVSRTVSYAVVVALLAGAYVIVVSAVSALVPDRFGSVAVVLATLAVSALFVPVRRRVIGVVDRRFNRSRYDAAVVVAEFAERVRGRAGAGTTGTTGEDLVAAAHRVLQPTQASVWLAPGGRS